MPDTNPLDQRTGHGQWTAIMRPAIGILWVSDSGAIGFQPTKNVDPTPVTTLIETYQAAGKNAADTFADLAAAIGSRIETGRLDDWRAERGRYRSKA
jgi:hypothetical protein